MNQSQNKDFDPNNWYDRHGVARPEHIPHGLTDDELEEKFRQIREKTVHGKWTQEGDRLTCNRCNPPHTSEPVEKLRPPHNYILTGTDDKGLPILTKIG